MFHAIASAVMPSGFLSSRLVFAATTANLDTLPRAMFEGLFGSPFLESSEISLLATFLSGSARWRKPLDQGSGN